MADKENFRIRHEDGGDIRRVGQFLRYTVRIEPDVEKGADRANMPPDEHLDYEKIEQCLIDVVYDKDELHDEEWSETLNVMEFLQKYYNALGGLVRCSYDESGMTIGYSLPDTNSFDSPAVQLLLTHPAMRRPKE